jgi:hypothetical protein
VFSFRPMTESRARPSAPTPTPCPPCTALCLAALAALAGCKQRPASRDLPPDFAPPPIETDGGDAPEDARAGPDAGPDAAWSDASPAPASDAVAPADEAADQVEAFASPLSAALAGLHDRLAKDAALWASDASAGGTLELTPDLRRDLALAAWLPLPEGCLLSVTALVPVDIAPDGDPELILSAFTHGPPEDFEELAAWAGGELPPCGDRTTALAKVFAVLRWRTDRYVPTWREVQPAASWQTFDLPPPEAWERRDIDADGTLEVLAEASETHTDYGTRSLLVFGLRSGTPLLIGAIPRGEHGTGGKSTEVAGSWVERSGGPGLAYRQVVLHEEEACPDHDRVSQWETTHLWELRDGDLADGAADGERPVRMTDDVPVRLLPATGDDVHDGALAAERDVATDAPEEYDEQGTYATFSSAARSFFAGVPLTVAIGRVCLEAAYGSSGVGSIADLFRREAEVWIAAAGGERLPLARLAPPRGRREWSRICGDVGPGTDLSPLADALRDGTFRIGVLGATPRRPEDDFEARLTVTLSLAAVPAPPP